MARQSRAGLAGELRVAQTVRHEVDAEPLDLDVAGLNDAG